MNFENIRGHLKEEIFSLETKFHFNQAKKRHHSLKRFSSPYDVVNFLREKDMSSVVERSDVTMACISEMKKKTTSCWGSILILGNIAWLSHILKKSSPFASMGEEELERYVAERFLNVAAKIKKSCKVSAVNLPLGTSRDVERGILKELQYENHEYLFAEPLEKVDFNLDGTQARLLDAKKQLLKINRYLNKYEFAENEYELFVLSALKKILITEWVKQKYPNASENELQRQRRKVRRRKTRFLEQLKEVCGYEGTGV